jgi:hypothetical protein
LKWNVEPKSAAEMRRRIFIALIAVLLIGILAAIFLESPPPPPPLVMLPSASWPVKTGRIPDRWIPPKWTWLQKLCSRIRGKSRQVTLDVELIEVSEPVKSVVDKNKLGQPQLESDGVAAWIVSAEKPMQFDGSATISKPRVTMADRMQAAMFVGSTTNSSKVEVYVRLKRDSSDLWTRVTFSDGTQTNFLAAVRAQVPWNDALFVIDDREPAAATNRRAFWISPFEVDAAGNRLHGNGN